MTAKAMTFQSTAGKPNQILKGDGFFVSYNPSTGSLMSAFRGDGDGIETALCGPDGQYLILNGDYRKEYEEAAPHGYEACRAIYEANRSTSRSGWSEDGTPAETVPYVLGKLLGGAE